MKPRFYKGDIIEITSLFGNLIGIFDKYLDNDRVEYRILTPNPKYQHPLDRIKTAGILFVRLIPTKITFNSESYY